MALAARQGGRHAASRLSGIIVGSDFRPGLDFLSLHIDMPVRKHGSSARPRGCDARIVCTQATLDDAHADCIIGTREMAHDRCCNLGVPIVRRMRRFALWHRAMGWRIGSTACPIKAQIMQHAPRVIAALMPTLFIELRMMHVPIAWCYASQAVAVMFAGFLVWRGFRTSHDTPQGPVLRFALFAAAAVFASPYWMGYDLLMLTWAVIGVLRVNAWKNMRIWLCIALYFLPVLCFVLHVLGLPGMPLLILTFAFWMLREIKHAHAPSAASPDAAANDSTPAKPALR